MIENKRNKQVFCRFMEKDVLLEKRDNKEEWVCKAGKPCDYWDEEYKDEKVMTAFPGYREPEIEQEIKDVVIICRHLMAWRGKYENNKI